MMKLIQLRTVVLAGVVAFAMTGIARAEDGASLYKTKCQVCHGADGKGETAAGKKLGVKDFGSPEVKKQSEEDLIKVVKEGKNKMPSYEKKLTDDQIKELVKYIRTLK